MRPAFRCLEYRLSVLNDLGNVRDYSISPRRSDALPPEDADHSCHAGASTTRLWGNSSTALADSPKAQSKFKATGYEICDFEETKFRGRNPCRPCCAPRFISGGFQVVASVGVYDGERRERYSLAELLCHSEFLHDRIPSKLTWRVADCNDCLVSPRNRISPRQAILFRISSDT